jgi:hypothetical protein
MNRSSTHKQIEGQNQPMQLDLLKVLPRSTLLLLLKFVAKAEKCRCVDVVFFYNSRVFDICRPET